MKSRLFVSLLVAAMIFVVGDVALARFVAGSWSGGGSGRLGPATNVVVATDLITMNCANVANSCYDIVPGGVWINESMTGGEDPPTDFLYNE